MGKIKKTTKTTKELSNKMADEESTMSSQSRRKSLVSVSSLSRNSGKTKKGKRIPEFVVTKLEDTSKSEVIKRTTKSKREQTGDEKKNISVLDESAHFQVQNAFTLNTRILEECNIKIDDIHSALKGISEFHSTNPKVKNLLFSENFSFFLQVNCHRIPLGYPKIMRIPLKNSVLSPDGEICLIVSEVKGIGNKEHERHVEHYEKLLDTKGIKNIKKIMTMHELKTEYETFEQKSRLVDSYDIFLVCGKISGKVVKKCGKIFYEKRKVPIPVKLQCTKLKEHIDKSLSKVFFHLHLKGDSYTLQFGHNQMDTKQLVENLCCVVEFLKKEFPGGFNNIKGLHVFAPRAPSIPIYFSTEPPTEKIRMQIPKTIAFETHTGELTTLPNATVTVKPTGEVTVKKLPSDYETTDKITDEDIIRVNKEESDTSKNVEKNKKRKLNQDFTNGGSEKRKKKVAPKKESAKELCGSGEKNKNSVPKKETTKELPNKEMKNRRTVNKRKNLILSKKDKLKKIKKLQK